MKTVRPLTVRMLLLLTIGLGAGALASLAAQMPPEDAAALAEFERRVAEYAALHDRFEGPVVTLEVSDDPAEIRAAVTALAGHIRATRPNARQGDIFTPAIGVVIRRLIATCLRGQDPDQLVADLKEEMEEGGPVPTPAVNASYPPEAGLAMMTPLVLCALPELPSHLQYRFVDHTLVLLDVHANLMVDYLPAAVGSTSIDGTTAPKEARGRARDLGVAPGVFEPGPLNAITDVDGVKVGHVTIVRGEDVRTGVTAILPHGGNVFQEKVPGAVFVGNAFGKLAGSTQVAELGTIETPIVLTNTLSVGTAVDAVVRHVLAQPGNEEVRSVNALVGETNDGGLNDIRGPHVQAADVTRAIVEATGGEVREGSVGAGTGTRAYGWKGGIGTSSRVLPARYGGYRLGVLVQTNFGGVLTIGGAPVGKELGRYAFAPAPSAGAGGEDAASLADGSCMIVVATDAPLDARDLERLAARAIFGLARTGSSYSNGSGDFAIAFSTAPDLRVRVGDGAPRARTLLPSDGVSPLFQAVLEATEEAVYNSLLQATTVRGRGQTAEAIPVARVREILQKYGMGVAGDR